MARCDAELRSRREEAPRGLARIASAYTLQDALTENQREAWTALAKFTACFQGLDAEHATLEDAACIQGRARDLLAQVQMVESTARFVKSAYREVIDGPSHGH